MLEKIDQYLPKLFTQYDVDGSSTLNNVAELMQLTVNLTFQLGLPMKADDLTKIKELVNKVGIKNWSQQQFRDWYIKEVMKMMSSTKT